MPTAQQNVDAALARAKARGPVPPLKPVAGAAVKAPARVPRVAQTPEEAALVKVIQSSFGAIDAAFIELASVGTPPALPDDRWKNALHVADDKIRAATNALKTAIGPYRKA